MEIELDKPKRKNPKRMIFNIPEDLHTQIKSRAAIRNISMRLWVLRTIIKELKEEQKYN